MTPPSASDTDVRKTILVIGTYDTKSEDLAFIAEKIEGLGGAVVTMDTSVLGPSPVHAALSRHDVAAAAGTTIDGVIGSGDENAAIRLMSLGAARLTADLHARGAVDAMIALGGTLGTDLALDCARALPLGVPKVIVSTVAFSPLIPADRLAPDVQMILWAGGLFGMNAIGRSALAQAAGAVLGAARAAEPPRTKRPLIGMTSFGLSCLTYMRRLKPALDGRGFETAIFHATGMGGMAFERLAEAGAFAAVLDLAPQELGNHMFGSAVNAGPDRLRGAGRAGVPQIVAPGCLDLVDLAAWQDLPARFAGRPVHDHNRLLKSAVLDADERCLVVEEVGRRLAEARGPVRFVLPARGLHAWDQPGGPAHAPDALAAFMTAARRAIRPPAILTEIDAHINDDAFADAVLAIVDGWVADGTLPDPQTET